MGEVLRSKRHILGGLLFEHYKTILFLLMSARGNVDICLLRVLTPHYPGYNVSKPSASNCVLHREGFYMGGLRSKDSLPPGENRHENMTDSDELISSFF